MASSISTKMAADRMLRDERIPISHALQSLCAMRAVLTVAFFAVAASGQGDIVLKFYDVRAIVARDGMRSSWGFGWIDGPDSPPRRPDWEFVPGLDPDEMKTIITIATSPEYWTLESSSMQMEESGYLVVKASQEMQQRVETLLELLEDWLLEPIDIEVHFLPSTAAKGMLPILNRDEVDAVLRAAGPHSVLRQRSRFGQATTMESSVVRPFVSGCTQSAAQAASIIDPEVGEVSWGFSGYVVARRTTSDHVWVHADVRMGRSPEQMLSPDASNLVSSKRPHGISMELLRQDVWGWAGEALVSDGQGFLAGTTSGAGLIACIVVRRNPVSRRPPLMVAGSDESKFAMIPIRDLITGSWARYLYPIGIHRGMTEVEESMTPHMMDDGRLREVLGTLVGSDASIMQVGGGGLMVMSDEAAIQAVAAALREMGKLANRQFAIQLRYGYLTADQRTETGTRSPDHLTDVLSDWCVASVVGGRVADVLALRQHRFVSDYKVKVEPDVAVAAPVAGDVVEGFQCISRLQPVGKRRVRLELELAHGDLEEPIATIDLKDSRFGPLHEPKVTAFRERLAAVVDLDRWTLLTLSPVPDTDRHFAVIVRVTEL